MYNRRCTGKARSYILALFGGVRSSTYMLHQVTSGALSTALNLQSCKHTMSVGTSNFSKLLQELFGQVLSTQTLSLRDKLRCNKFVRAGKRVLILQLQNVLRFGGTSRWPYAPSRTVAVKLISECLVQIFVHRPFRQQLSFMTMETAAHHPMTRKDEGLLPG